MYTHRLRSWHIDEWRHCATFDLRDKERLELHVSARRNDICPECIRRTWPTKRMVSHLFGVWCIGLGPPKKSTAASRPLLNSNLFLEFHIILFGISCDFCEIPAFPPFSGNFRGFFGKFQKARECPQQAAKFSGRGPDAFLENACKIFKQKSKILTLTFLEFNSDRGQENRRRPT